MKTARPWERSPDRIRPKRDGAEIPTGYEARRYLAVA